MNAGYWAGDAIATQISANGAAARARSTLERQQSYHAGDIAIQRAALAALHDLAPDHPIFTAVVRDRIFSIAEREMYRRGWGHASQLLLDPNRIKAELQAQFDAARVLAIKKADGEPVGSHRRGWLFVNRRSVYTWRGVEHLTPQEAETARQSELARLRAVQLGDQLSVP